MVRQGYKEVQLLGKNIMIPEEWEINKLNDYIDVLSGYSFSSDKFNNEEDGLPLIRIRDLQESEISTYFNGEYDEKYIIDRDDILIGMDGNFYVEKWDNNKALLNQRVCRVESKSEELDQNYLYYRIKPEIDKIHRITPATTVKHLSIKDIKKTRIPFPPLPEQKKTASILSSVDNSIEKTDEVIEATKELKKGLMQELLTKGIGHSEFKDSQFGKIPKEWRVEQVKNVSNINLGASPSSDTYNDSGNGLPFFQGNADFGFLYPVPTQWCTEPQKIAKKGEVLISVRAPVGELNLAPFECCIGRGLTSIDGDSVENKFIYYYFKQFKAKLKSYSQGSTFSAITKSILETFPILVPPLEEQKKIASILSSVDSKIQKEEEYKAKLERLKKGLMQKLLTGEIRVNIDMEV